MLIETTEDAVYQLMKVEDFIYRTRRADNRDLINKLEAVEAALSKG